jgi:hypothetical protein
MRGCNVNCDRSGHTGLQTCSIVWTKVKDTLPEHVQEFARNVGTQRKSKNDVAVDMSERKAAASAMQVAFNPDLDEVEEMLDASFQINGAVDDDTLRLSYHLIRGTLDERRSRDSSNHGKTHPLCRLKT